jgi:hypothetical protein
MHLMCIHVHKHIQMRTNVRTYSRTYTYTHAYTQHRHGARKFPTRHPGAQHTHTYAYIYTHTHTHNAGMELANFPFDIQELNITLTINEPEHHFRIVVNQAYPPVFQVANFQMVDIFHVPLEDVVLAHPYNSSPSESSSGLVYPRCIFTIYISRRGGYYVSNVMVPMAVLTMLTMVSCGLEPTGETLSTGDRLSVTLTLLLTAVAYKFVVASSLPQVCACMCMYI